MDQAHAQDLAGISAAVAHFDVIIVGAGLSGIAAAYRLQTGSRSENFVILETREAIGGTWDLFRYPGIRSDSDVATLGFPFRPWREEGSIVGGADWSNAAKNWTLRVETPAGPATFKCRFLFMCSGYYDYARGYLPTWSGMEAFRGRIVHPQFWPDALDYGGKRIVVIGSGATAVTMVPALAKQAAHVTMLQRSPSYVFTRPARDKISSRLRKWLPGRLADIAIRWKDIGYVTFTYQLARRRPARMRRLIAAAAREQLGPDFDMTHFSPRYEPWDQRLCVVPDGDLFETLRRGDASIVTGEIDTLTPEGVRLKSGESLAADLIVTATGLSLQLMGGARISMDGRDVDVTDCLVYRGFMLEDVPNFAFAVGYTNAAWTLRTDLSARSVSRLLNHMRRRGYAAVTPAPRDPAMTKRPLIDMTSGYLQRAANLLPRQGDKEPWKLRQNYLRDQLSFRLMRLEDGNLRFARRQ